LDLRGISVLILFAKTSHVISKVFFQSTKGTAQTGASKFTAKSNTKSSGGMKKPIKTGGARGS